jgi:hypothetical protein
LAKHWPKVNIQQFEPINNFENQNELDEEAHPWQLEASGAEGDREANATGYGGCGAHDFSCGFYAFDHSLVWRLLEALYGGLCLVVGEDEEGFLSVWVDVGDLFLSP